MVKKKSDDKDSDMKLSLEEIIIFDNIIREKNAMKILQQSLHEIYKSISESEIKFWKDIDESHNLNQKKCQINHITHIINILTD